MPTPPGGLGRGLDALLGGRMDPESPEVQMVPLAAIRPNPDQPRRFFARESLEELAQSIRAQGVLQPILVRPRRGEGGQRYEIVAGERRYRAAGLAGLAEVPVLVRELSAEDSLAVALIENLQREDLNPMEEAAGLRELQDRLKLSQEALAAKVGKGRSTVANTLRLLALSQAAQADMLEGRITAGHARQILALDDATLQEELRQRVVAEGLSVREAEELVQHAKEHGGFPVAAAATPESPAEQGSQPDARPKAVAPRRAVPVELKNICAGIGRNLGVKVRVSGGEDKGAVSLRYGSTQELARILNLLATLNGMGDGSPKEQA